MSALVLAPIHRRTVTLPRTLKAPAAARCWALGLIIAWQVPVSRNDIELGVSEMVTNAVRYAIGARIIVRALVNAAYLRLAVIDEDGRRLPMPTGDLADALCAEGGRGLLMLDATSSKCGSWKCPTGKSVWACYDIQSRITSGGVS